MARGAGSVSGAFCVSRLFHRCVKTHFSRFVWSDEETRVFWEHHSFLDVKCLFLWSANYLQRHLLSLFPPGKLMQGPFGFHYHEIMEQIEELGKTPWNLLLKITELTVIWPKFSFQKKSRHMSTRTNTVRGKKQNLQKTRNDFEEQYEWKCSNHALSFFYDFNCLKLRLLFNRNMKKLPSVARWHFCAFYAAWLTYREVGC